ncbi:MAG: hypothetical protein SOZ39_04800 [Desulfovibrio piger]|uniref:hypothetical protein n=1 Tax=Desulfovibrio piger TaxID=901 RepID=UPI002A82DA33|nr:hypothetical protein [Desulfovibrio piger]MDY3880441.1 hypothetical protein [Desulfovibrio piger]
MTTPWRHGRRWMLEKEIQFQKEDIKEQDARQAQDMPLLKNIRIQLKTFIFLKRSRPGQIRRPTGDGLFPVWTSPPI